MNGAAAMVIRLRPGGAGDRHRRGGAGTFALALMFHIVFAALGVVMPFMVLASQWLYLRRGHPL